MKLKSYYDIVHNFEAGCDEVGRGCLAGPVVAAAVILPKSFYHPRLTDSKKVSPKERKYLEEVIKRESVAWAIGSCNEHEIGELNILRASFKAMHRALNKLAQKPDFILVDGNKFDPYAQLKHACVIKGDSKYLSIAAASILAKEYRDDLMRNLSQEFPHYGWEKNVGYPTKQHRAAIKQHGITRHHRKSFRLLPNQMEVFKTEFD